jgi:hypothetical protein
VSLSCCVALHSILEGSQITANAFTGHRGNIQIRAAAFLADPASRVTASSTLGLNGEVNIQALTNVSGVVAPLPQTFAQAGVVLRERCAERRRGGRTSTLVLAGRNGLPAEPGGVWPSPLARAALLDRTASGGPSEPARVADARGLRGDDNGSPHRRGRPAPGLLPERALEGAKGQEEGH